MTLPGIKTIKLDNILISDIGNNNKFKLDINVSSSKYKTVHAGKMHLTREVTSPY